MELVRNDAIRIQLSTMCVHVSQGGLASISSFASVSRQLGSTHIKIKLFEVYVRNDFI